MKKYAMQMHDPGDDRDSYPIMIPVAHGQWYSASDVDALIAEMQQAATRRVAELEKASDISIEINNGLHQRIAELEQALREATICSFCGQMLARGQCTGHCDNDE